MSHSLLTAITNDLFPFFFDGAILTDPQGYIIAINQPALDYIPGATVSQLVGQPIKSYLHSQKVNQFFTNRIEMRNVPISIGMNQILANFHFFESKEALIILRNVTALNRLNNELKTVNQQMRVIGSMLDEVDEGICFIDKNQKILFYNKKQGEMDSREVSDVESKQYTDAFPAFKTQQSPLLYSLENEKEVIQSETFFSNNGKKYSVVRKCVPLFIGNQKVGGVLITKDYSDTEDFVKSFYLRNAQPGLEHVGNTEEHLAPSFLFHSKLLSQLQNELSRLGDPSVNILLHGKHGTGKNALARYIVEKLDRNPVHYLNCAVLSFSSLEETLFGKGDTTSLLELSKGGTIILDQLTSMPTNLQAKLLSYLETMATVQNEQKKNVQVISIMTDKPLNAIRQKRLNENLFYLLGSISYYLPVLLEQKETISTLAEGILNEQSSLFDGKERSFADETFELLTGYHFPGNTRQLIHIIESAITRFPGEMVIRPEHLPDYLKSTHNQYTGDSSDLSSNGISLVEAVEEFERRLIIQTLDRCGHHLTNTADQLGISRQSLNYKIRKYAIEITK